MDQVKRKIIEQLIDVVFESVVYDESSEVEDVNEFSGVGSISGFMAPLGFTPKKNSVAKKKRRKRRK